MHVINSQACVWIPSGSILVQQCDISSESLACVEIEAANPRIVNNDIHSSPQVGGMTTLNESSSLAYSVTMEAGL